MLSKCPTARRATTRCWISSTAWETPGGRDAFTYLFGLENTLVHTLMVAALALIIALSLFSVASLDHPFKGDVRIHPDAFEQVLERFDESKLSDL
jgi:hypothetical protein